MYWILKRHRVTRWIKKQAYEETNKNKIQPCAAYKKLTSALRTNTGSEWRDGKWNKINTIWFKLYVKSKKPNEQTKTNRIINTGKKTGVCQGERVRAMGEIDEGAQGVQISNYKVIKNK